VTRRALHAGHDGLVPAFKVTVQRSVFLNGYRRDESHGRIVVAHDPKVAPMTGVGGPTVVEARFPGVTTSPAQARSFLRNALHAWSLDVFVAVTELLTDELVANVVEHVHTPMTVRAICHGRAIRIEVDDPSTEPPRLLHPGPYDFGGRGLLLVDTLSDRWGTDLRPEGKTVWFELDVSATKP
jgi:anti-sigma regulatory factor (Ser/Thr protein kinase)